MAVGFLKCRLGNGRHASFWFDSWTRLGPLISFVGCDGPRNFRVPLNAKVVDAYNSTGWTLANPRSNQAMELHVHLTTINLPREENGSGSYDWVVNNNSCKGFSSPKTWEVLRPKADLVSWYESIWFKGATPKHAFTMWIANLDRLPTKSRLTSWGMNIQTICGLCDRFP